MWEIQEGNRTPVSKATWEVVYCRRQDAVRAIPCTYTRLISKGHRDHLGILECHHCTAHQSTAAKAAADPSPELQPAVQVSTVQGSSRN